MSRKIDRAEEASFAYQRELTMNDYCNDETLTARRLAFKDGFNRGAKAEFDNAISVIHGYFKLQGKKDSIEECEMIKFFCSEMYKRNHYDEKEV